MCYICLKLIEYDLWNMASINPIDKRIDQELKLMNGFAGIQNMSIMVGCLSLLVYFFIYDFSRFKFRSIFRLLSEKTRFRLLNIVTLLQFLVGILIIIIQPT